MAAGFMLRAFTRAASEDVCFRLSPWPPNVFELLAY